jgi:plasmid stabilization system protein ParE
MKYHVIFQPRALQNLEGQYQHIASHNPRAAARWFNRFVTALEGLSQFPERSPIARESDLTGREIRQLLFGKRQGVRRAFFVIEQQTVRILSIRHASQSEIDPDDLLE